MCLMTTASAPAPALSTRLPSLAPSGSAWHLRQTGADLQQVNNVFQLLSRTIPLIQRSPFSCRCTALADLSICALRQNVGLFDRRKGRRWCRRPFD